VAVADLFSVLGTVLAFTGALLATLGLAASFFAVSDLPFADALAFGLADGFVVLFAAILVLTHLFPRATIPSGMARPSIPHVPKSTPTSPLLWLVPAVRHPMHASCHFPDAAANPAPGS
jgi:hypothetical protein